MVVKLYAAPQTQAYGNVFTFIDFLAFSIWENMAHIPDEDYLQSQTPSSYNSISAMEQPTSEE